MNPVLLPVAEVTLHQRNQSGLMKIGITHTNHYSTLLTFILLEPNVADRASALPALVVMSHQFLVLDAVAFSLRTAVHRLQSGFHSGAPGHGATKRILVAVDCVS